MQPRTPSFITLRTIEFKLSDWRGKLSSRLLMGKASHRNFMYVAAKRRAGGSNASLQLLSSKATILFNTRTLPTRSGKTSRKSAHVSNLSLATTPLFQLQDLCQQFCSQCHTFCIRKESHACLHTFDTLWSLGQSVFPWVH